LEEVIDTKQPDLFNQAIMEFGAMHCTPAKPLCLYCEFQIECFAFQNQQQSQLPVKIKKVKVRKRYFHYLVFVLNNEVYLKERGKNDIWQGLHDFHLIESDNENINLDDALTKDQMLASELLNESSNFKHILTHQRITAKFYVINLLNPEPFKNLLSSMKAYDRDAVFEVPIPKLIDNYLNEVFFSLALYKDSMDE